MTVRPPRNQGVTILNQPPESNRSADPLVSVVTIFFNAQRFIQAAIESVFAQSYESWELLLVDDGSSDGSSAIARRYASELPQRVRYLEHVGHRNAGMSASRNLGIRHARGRYIAFLDSDDVWLPDKLRRQVAIMESHPLAGMVFGAPLYWSSWSGTPADARLDHSPPLGAPPDRLHRPPALALQLYPLGRGSAPCPSDLMIRRSAFDRVGLFEESFRGDYQLYEDQAFLQKMYLNAAVYVSEERWMRYRQHPDSCVAMVSQAGRYHDVRRFFLEWFERYLVDHRQRDARIWLALQSALWPYRHRSLVAMSRAASRSLRSTRLRTRRAARRALPPMLHHGWVGVRDLLTGRTRPTAPGPGSVRFGDLRRTEPLSRQFGFDRGLPIDRYYVEQFLERHGSDIRGRVLEVGDDGYSSQYGGDRIRTCDILHIDDTNPRATIVADLSHGDAIPSDTFDCVILTQTLHLIFDLRSAVRTLHRILKPGGVVLATLPGISQISDDQWDDSWYWGLTSLSAHRLFAEAFDPTLVLVEMYGNVLAATGFLQGLAANELGRAELEHRDPAYQVLIGVRAVRPRFAAP